MSDQTGASYRLPSEAEWEYAARASTTRPFSFDGPISSEKVNYDATTTYAGSKKGEYRKKTVVVGSLPANPWGLHEVHGNVWEWCYDYWRDRYDGAPTDGSAWTGAGDFSRRVLRGGSWSYEPQIVRSAYRYGHAPGYRYGDIGFRLARTL